MSDDKTDPNLTQAKLEKAERLTDRALRWVAGRLTWAAGGLNWVADRQGSWIIVAVLAVLVVGAILVLRW